jgi:hypothetical protein
MNPLIIQILTNLEKQIVLLGDQITEIQLSYDTPPRLKLTALRKKQVDLEIITKHLIQDLQEQLHQNLIDTQPLGNHFYRNSIRVARNSLQVISEHRLKLIIFILGILAGIFGKQIPEWISQVFRGM